MKNATILRMKNVIGFGDCYENCAIKNADKTWRVRNIRV